MARATVRAVHHPDKRHVEMPYAPALLVRGGQLLFLSGLTAAPVYHSHPHREEEFDLPPRMREQAVLLMENLRTTLAAAGCTLADVVSATRYLTDVAEQDDLNAGWASYLGAHRPPTTPGEAPRLATPPNSSVRVAFTAPPGATGRSRGARPPSRRASSRSWWVATRRCSSGPVHSSPPSAPR